MAGEVQRRRRSTTAGPAAAVPAGFLLAVLAAVGLVAAPPAARAADAEQFWDTWGTETYNLSPGESMQFRVAYDQIPVRRWQLVVEGDDIVCDLHVLRLKDGSLLYFKPDESRHEVSVPWGRGEEISVVMTAGRRAGGVFTVLFMGPPRDQAPASYSYSVNRALEAYAAGRRDEARGLCEQALRDDPDDAVAMVLLAGFLRDERFYERASGMVDRALALDLPPEMLDLAQQLKEDLARELDPVPAPVRDELARAETMLGDGDSQGALKLCDRLLKGSDRPTPPVRGLILQYRGRALHGLDRDFEALEALTTALQLTPRREGQALVYFHLGSLLADMGNSEQARGALQKALDYGLPSGMELQAQALLSSLGGKSQ